MTGIELIIKEITRDERRFYPRVPDDTQLVNQYIDAGADGFETDNVPFIRQCIEAKEHLMWPLPT